MLNNDRTENIQCQKGYGLEPYLNKCFSCPSSITNCQLCTEIYHCDTCIDRFFPFEAHCRECPLDCFTCTEDDDCLSCSASDFRILKGNRCIPMEGYFESFIQKSFPCPPNCINCSEEFNCAACLKDYVLRGSTCMPLFVQPPDDFYTIGIMVECAIILFLLTAIFYLFKGRIQRQNNKKDQEKVDERTQQKQTALEKPKKKGMLRNMVYKRESNEHLEDNIQSASQLHKSSDFDTINKGGRQWKEQQRENVEDFICAYCKEKRANFSSNCGHFFHSQCLIQGYKESTECPVCQFPLSDDEHDIICRQCFKKKSKVTISDLLESQDKGERNILICHTCRASEFA